MLTCIHAQLAKVSLPIGVSRVSTCIALMTLVEAMQPVKITPSRTGQIMDRFFAHEKVMEIVRDFLCKRKNNFQIVASSDAAQIMAVDRLFGTNHDMSSRMVLRACADV